MAFGDSIKTGATGTTTATTATGANYNNIFVSSKPGEYHFRPLGSESLIQEHLLRVNIGNGESWRSVFVEYKNLWDDLLREEIKDLPKEEQKKLWSKKGAKRRFVCNVLYRLEDTSEIRVLKGSWNKQTHFDSATGELTQVEGKTLHADILRLDKGSQRRDPVTGKPVLLRLGQFDLRLVIAGENLNKSYNIFTGFNNDPLTEDEMALPLYDLETWVKRAVWPYEAQERLRDGENYYDLVAEYGILLYPEKYS